MNNKDNPDSNTSFLGTGWSFPPSFSDSGVNMSSDEADIHESLLILFGTTIGERFLQPKYGLDMHELMFEPISTTLRTFLIDRIRTEILIFEPRIKVVNLSIDTPHATEGTLNIVLEYEVRATNSRFNLVYPFYRFDGNEVSAQVAGTIRRG
ncbi:MAG TPA: GPW/gp25 family protein [Gallionella sp.]|nr:GPW/gp25 family protein [Gallionella sp.]